MEIKNVAIIGAGIMGRQIAMNTAMHGYKAILNDNNEESLKNAESWANEWLRQRVSKQKITEEKSKEVQFLLSFEVNLESAVKDADLVIEAIIEKEDIKYNLFKKLDEITPKHTLLVSNSSFIPSSLIAKATKRQDKIANFHYFNPALVMKLVEVVQGEHTSNETIESLIEFAKNTGKEPVWVKKEIEGFIANRILSKIVSEAYYLVEQGIVTPQEVDIAVEKGLNHPMGPFRLMDFSGIDLAYLAKKRRYEMTGNAEDKPPKFLEEKYKKGEFGRKTGKGWYDYSQK